MNYKILLIFAMTAITTTTLSLTIYNSNAFAINEKSINLPNATSFTLGTDNNSSIPISICSLKYISKQIVPHIKIESFCSEISGYLFLKICKR